MALAAKVLTVSDSVAVGTRPDGSGPALVHRLEDLGLAVVHTSVVADDIAPITQRLRELTAGFAGLVVTTGGTGFGPRDLTPEATAQVIERAAPGLAEAVRSSSSLGALSRGIAGSVGQCLVLNLPGSPSAVIESIDAVAPLLPHVLALLAGEGTPHPAARTKQHVPGHTTHEPGHEHDHSDTTEPQLTHVDGRGHARMVDVSGKPPTHRLARAACRVILSGELDACLPDELDVPDLLGEARIAGIQGAKLTASLIPLCHPLALSAVTVDLTVATGEVAVSATAENVERTGVEMEALTACTMAALTIVGACRQSDPPPAIEDLTLWEKLGGRSGHWRRQSAFMP